MFSLVIAVLVGCSATKKNMVLLSSDDASLRKEAIINLGIIGPLAKKSGEFLMPIAKKETDIETRRLAIEALGNIQPVMNAELCDVFVLAMNDENPHIRRAAIIAITKFPNFPPNFINIMQKRLNDPDHLTRELVMSTFERIGKLGIRALKRALKDKDCEIRLGAVTTLSRLGEEAISAVALLKEVKSDDHDVSVRKAAEDALRVIVQ